MGLKKGEKIKRLAVIEVVSIRREPLSFIDQADCYKEGFPDLTPLEFVIMLCDHYSCTAETEFSRIEFKYISKDNTMARAGIPKRDSSGKGRRANQGRGDCKATRKKGKGICSS